MANNFKFEDNSKKIKAHLNNTTLKALKEAAMVVESAAKALAPHPTGELRDKIDHEIKPQRNMSVAQIGSPTDYSVYVEFGTGEHAENRNGRKGGWGYVDEEGKKHWTYGQKPQPFLRPAFRNNKNNIEKIIGTTLKSEMDGK